MTVDHLLGFFRAISPLISFIVVPALGVFGWFFNRLIKGLEEKIDLRFCDLSNRVGKLEREFETFKKEEHQAQLIANEKYVTRDMFYRADGGKEEAIKTIFEKINELSAAFNQWVGALKERRKADAQTRTG